MYSNGRASKREDLTITNGDKSSVVVFIDTDIYIKETNWHLSDKASYTQWAQDPTLQPNRMFNQTIKWFRNEKLLKKTADGVKISDPKTPKFYISPKINKPNNPGRLVINSIECQISEILRFTDHHFQLVLKHIPYMKDTNRQ